MQTLTGLGAMVFDSKSGTDGRCKCLTCLRCLKMLYFVNLEATIWFRNHFAEPAWLGVWLNWHVRPLGCFWYTLEPHPQSQNNQNSKAHPKQLYRLINFSKLLWKWVNYIICILTTGPQQHYTSYMQLWLVSDYQLDSGQIVRLFGQLVTSILSRLINEFAANMCKDCMCGIGGVIGWRQEAGHSPSKYK